MINGFIIMSGNTLIAQAYLDWFSKNYTQLKYKYFNFCKEKNYSWDEDIFSDTYLKIYDCIIKNGIADSSEKGFDNYTFKSFKNNIMNESRYCRVKNRDNNINSDNINDLYEIWYNENYSSEKTKLLSDLWKDFSVIYIMHRVEHEFDAEHFYLFKEKTLMPNMTFKKLQEKTKIKSSRKKVIEVMHWVKDHITKEEIRKEFYDLYGDII